MTQNLSIDIPTARPDVTLLLDKQGVIRNVTLANTFAAGDVNEWIGRPWDETVGGVGDEKVKRMVAEATETGVSAFRQFTQSFPSGLELPMEYTTVQLDADGGMLAVGKNLQAVAELQSRLITAQQAMEQEYWKLRYLEARYRLLMDESNEPVLLVKASNMQIVEANPIAARSLGINSRGGGIAERSELFNLVQPGERRDLELMLIRVRDQGKAPAMLLHIGTDQTPWYVRASLATSEQGLVFLLQFTPAGVPRVEQDETSQFNRLIDRVPDAIVMTDKHGTIMSSNQAFLDLIQVGSKASLAGQCIDRWLGRPGADMKVLFANVARHGSVRLFSTLVQGDLGITTEVEISAIGDNVDNAERIALVLRDVGSRLPLPAPNHPAGDLGSILNSLTRKVGNEPLRSLVQDTVSVVERHYIEAALDLTDGNRTAAAEMLGLSRQSLYTKLDRYKISGAGDTTK